VTKPLKTDIAAASPGALWPNQAWCRSWRRCSPASRSQKHVRRELGWHYSP